MTREEEVNQAMGNIAYYMKDYDETRAVSEVKHIYSSEVLAEALKRLCPDAEEEWVKEVTE